jgi:NAD(P)H dehydrogenase (quinone)
VVYTSAPRATTSALILAPEHKATEEYLAASGLGWAIARNNWYNENYLPGLAAAAASGVLLGAAGAGRVASASRADLAAGAVALLTAAWVDGAVHEFGGDVAWDYTDLAAAYAEVLGVPVTYEALTPAELVAALVAAGVPRGGAEFVAAIDASIAEGALAETTGELSALLGRPTTPLRETLRSAGGS